MEYRLGKPQLLILTFGDDVVVFAEKLEALVHALDIQSSEFVPLGLKFFRIKSKI